jgi:beta-lactamase regulating signal transducer with metallopeptidase domain
MLAGILHPRLVISRGVRHALTYDELAVAIRHEQAHGESRDNLKRLILLLVPDAVPFVRLGRLERAWRRLAEWSADDCAVDADRQRSLALASALVRVARMGGAAAVPLPTPLLGDRDDLSVRVERLLAGAVVNTAQHRLWPSVVLALAVTAVAIQPATFVAMHRALEALAH